MDARSTVAARLAALAARSTGSTAPSSIPDAPRYRQDVPNRCEPIGTQAVRTKVARPLRLSSLFDDLAGLRVVESGWQVYRAWEFVQSFAAVRRLRCRLRDRP